MAFETEKYMGLWYEVFRQNAPFEAPCDTNSDITAYYSLNYDGNVDVINTCSSRYYSGNISIRGIASPTQKPGIFDLKFENIPFTSKYEVYYTDYDNYSIVGNLNNNYLSFLSRSDNITVDEFIYLRNIAEGYGFTVEK